MIAMYRGRKDYPIRCTLKKPIYSDKEKITWEESSKFIWCREDGFRTEQTIDMNKRKKSTKGTLITNWLKKDEISLDWRIIYDGDEYIITEIVQEDDLNQQGMMKNVEVITRLEVRR